MSDFCRLCGIVKDLYELSEIDDSELLLEFKLKSCFNISLTFDKLMPQNVCSECIQCLEKSFVFHQNILNVQEDLVQNMKHNVKKEILDCNIECIVLLEQIPSSLLRRSTRKVEDIHEIENTIQTEFELKNKKQIKLKKVKKVKFSIPAQKKISSTNKKAIKVENKKVAKASKVKLSRTTKKKSCRIRQTRVYTMKEVYVKELNGIFERTPKTFDGNEDITNSIVWSKYIWKCDKCDLRFNDITLLEQHHFESHSNEIFQYCCFSCPTSILHKYAVINHITIHQPYLRFCCIYCSKYHTSFIDLYHHYVQNHPKTNIFLCFYCGKLSQNGSTAKTHRQKHFETKDYACDLCGKEFKFLSNIESHLQKMHIKSSPKIETMNFICEICGAAFNGKIRLSEHQIIHDDNYVFGCNICEKRFPTMSKLRAHTKHHLKIKNMICPVCGKAFVSKSGLKVHRRIHEDKYLYDCEFCDKKNTNQT